MSSTERAQSLSDVLEQLVDNTEGEKITFGDLVEALESRSYGPLLMLAGIVAISPIGAIPGMSIATASMIILICVQMLAGRKRPWLPQKLLSIRFQRNRLTKSVDGGLAWVRWFERFTRHRLAVLAKGPAMYGIAVVSIGLAITFYPLALVPMGVFLPGLAISSLAMGVTARDGLLVLFGYAITLFAVATLVAF